MAIQNLAELQAQTGPTHEYGDVALPLAQRYVGEIEEQLYNGSGVRFNLPPAPQLMIEEMMARVLIPAITPQATLGVLQYRIPTDLVKARILVLDDVMLVFESSSASARNRDCVYRVFKDLYEVPHEGIFTDANPAPGLLLEYYQHFPSLLLEPNFISLKHPSIYLNGFIALVMTDNERPDKATEYWQIYSSTIQRLNDTGHQEKFVGQEMRTMGLGRRRAGPV